MTDAGDFVHSIEWGTTVCAAFDEIFHDEHHNSPTLDAIFFSYEHHVVRVEHRNVKTYKDLRTLHGTVVTGSHVALLHTLIFHEKKIINLLSAYKDTKFRPPFASILKGKFKIILV